MLKIGLTGGIGSGKTTVAKLFQTLGIPVYSADTAAKRLMQENELLQKQLIFHFGQETFTNGQLNRSHLAGIVFKDKEKLETLNQLVHPVTIADAENWFRLQTAPYVIKEAALLFESGAAEGLDAVIGVTASKSLRMQRVIQRDGVSREAVEQRMQHQLSETLKEKLCDFLIDNNEQVLVVPQVLALHNQFLKQSQPLIPAL